MHLELPLLAILGILNAGFLNWQYRRYVKTGKKMYCLIGEDCTKVVGSKYGKHFGIKNEITGIGYYLLILLYWGWPIFDSLTLVIAGISVIFSIYLLYLQAYVIKTFCSWCLIAIMLNFLIFFSIINLIITL